MIFKFIIDTLEHLHKNIFSFKLEVLLTEPILAYLYYNPTF